MIQRDRGAHSRNVRWPSFGRRPILKDTNAAQNKIDEISAILLDWHLWQIGEKLDREGTLKPHHRVRTIFY